MKRLEFVTSPTLDELLEFAEAFDAGRRLMDLYEMYELLNCLASSADLRLGLDSELRLGSTSVRKDSSGIVSVDLKNKKVSLKYCCPTTKHAA